MLRFQQKYKMADKWFQEGCLFGVLFLMYLFSTIHIPCQYELRTMYGYPQHNYEGRSETASEKLLLQLSLPPEGGHQKLMSFSSCDLKKFGPIYA